MSTTSCSSDTAIQIIETTISKADLCNWIFRVRERITIETNIQFQIRNPHIDVLRKREEMQQKKWACNACDIINESTSTKYLSYMF